MLRFLLAATTLLFSQVSWSVVEVEQGDAFRGVIGVDFFLGWTSGKVRIASAQDFTAGPFPSGAGIWRLEQASGDPVSLNGDFPRMRDAYWFKKDVTVSYNSPGVLSLELSEFEDDTTYIPAQVFHSEKVELFQRNHRVGMVSLGDVSCFAIRIGRMCGAPLDSPSGSIPPGGEWLVFGSGNTSIVLEKDFESLASGNIDLVLKIL